MACFKNEQGNVEGIGGDGIVGSIPKKRQDLARMVNYSTNFPDN